MSSIILADFTHDAPGMMADQPYQHNAAIGILLALLVITSWLVVHIYSLFFHELASPFWITAGLIAVQCWLYTGLFIVAHDAIHGVLFPNSPKANTAIGTAIFFVYAGFNWTIMRVSLSCEQGASTMVHAGRDDARDDSRNENRLEVITRRENCYCAHYDDRQIRLHDDGFYKSRSKIAERMKVSPVRPT